MSTDNDNTLVLQNQLLTVLKCISDLSTEIKELRDEVHKGNVHVAKLETEFKLRACPSPGKCESLSPKVEDVDKRLRVFEDGAMQLKGARKVTIILVMICSALGGAIGSKTMKVVDAVTSAVSSK